MDITRIADGTYRVVVDGRAELVYVAGGPSDRWAFWNGQIFRPGESSTDAGPHRPSRADGRQALHAPMPAHVRKVLVAPGATVKRGDTLIILEAMKMELSLRSEADATVQAVRCHEGELVHPEQILIELS